MHPFFPFLKGKLPISPLKGKTMRPNPPPDGSGLFGHTPHYFQPEIMLRQLR
jgi:hypothetical protein